MKVFNKRSLTAMLLTVAMMSTSVSSVFAEGSRELTKLPENVNQEELKKNRAVRPYLEWKDRDQFGMPSKNVVHVYAKAGETIFFGSDVTEANDRSIEAIVRTKSGFPSTISSAGKDWSGSSIAVTLPKKGNEEKEAFNPEDSTKETAAEIESLFLDGSELVNKTSANQNAVYLFQPVENGKGHIANPTMEENGPNGVDGTTDGYDPLSFVAPITGTYSFRFLSREYVNSDKVLIPLKDKSSLASKSIDFQGSLGELKDGAITADKEYYEPDYGDNIKIHGETKAAGAGSDRYNTVVTMTQDRTAPATAYSDAVTYKAGEDNYLTIGMNQTYGGGAISFTPLHDDVELEIVWRSKGSGSTEYFYAVQNGHGDTQSDRITVTTTGDMQVTRISNSGGYPIKAGDELRIYAQNLYKDENGTNRSHGIEIYEIRYYYNRVDVSDVETATEPTPTPEPTPEPTPTPEPIAWKYSVDMSIFSDYTSKQVISEEIEGLYKIEVPVGNGRKGTDGGKYETGSKEISGSTYDKWLYLYGNGTTDSGSLKLTAYQDNSWFEIIMEHADPDSGNYYENDTSHSLTSGKLSQGTVATLKTGKLSANQTTTIYQTSNDWNIYEIIYHVENPYPYSAMDESIDYTVVSADYTSDFGYDGTIADELYDMTFYSAAQNEDGSNLRGFQYRSVAEITVNETTYTEGLYQNAAASFLNMPNSVPTDKTGGVIAVTPKYENAKIEFVVRNDHSSKAVNVKATGAVTGTYGSIAVGETGSITTESLPAGQTTYLYFDQQWTNIYEIIYHFEGTSETGSTLEVMSLLENSADETAYAEWKFGTMTKPSAPYTLSTNSTNIIPILDGDGADKQIVVPEGTAYSWTGIDGTSYSMTGGEGGTTYRGIKMNAESKVTLDSKLSSSSYSSYDLKIAYMNFGNGDSRLKATSGDTELGIGGIVSGANEIGYLELPDLTADNIDLTRTNKELAILYVGLKYNSIETSNDWTANGSTYVTEADGVYTVTQPANSAASVASYNLLEIMNNAPADLTTADGTITVSYDLYRPSTNLPSADWFIDLSTNTNTKTHYSGGETGTFGRIGGYQNYLEKLVPGSGSTQGTIHTFSNNIAEDTWNTVTLTIDLSAKTITASWAGETSPALSDSYPTNIVNALYLNALPTVTTEDHDVSLQIRNITASYADAVVTPAPVDTTLKPVSNKYTWDFYNMKGWTDQNVADDPATPDQENRTRYTKDTLVGEYDNNPIGEDGKDYDYSYIYDMKVHATEKNSVTINNGNLYMYHSGEFNADGTPESSVLEFIPYWSGEVTVSFNYGNVQVKQLNGAESEIVTSAGNDDTKKITLRVEGGKPVYIYPTGGRCSTYIRGVKYTPDEPETGLERGIDEKWAVTGSMVAAWDITVAQGGGQSIAGDTYVWYPHQEFPKAKLESAGTLTSADGKLSMHRGGSYGEDTRVFDGETLSSLKLNQYKSNGSSNYLSFVPETSGTIKVTGYTGDGTYGNTHIWIAQESGLVNGKATTSYTMETISLSVKANEEVKIYASTNGASDTSYEVTDGNGTVTTKTPAAFFYKVEFTGNSQESGSGYTSMPGRAWSDIFFLNAGNYKASIYPKLNILTKEGFLYDFYMNGVQPYGFVFYSNNRGFLFDRWSLYSNPTWSGEKVVDTATGTGTKDRLQSLKHSFYSWSSGSDVGTPPVHIEKDGNNNPIIYNDNIMQSVIDGNYIPVDTAKDATHKMFFNTPQNNPAVLSAYTGLTSLREINTEPSVYSNILNNIDYVGLGNVAENDKDPITVNYGTIGIGGRFEVKVTQDDANTLAGLGANSIGVLLDFSKYDLTDTEVAPVPVLADDGTWAKWEDTTGVQTDNEKNNKVSLSTIITGAGDYTLAWDGRDAYGNVVPEGVYEDNIKSFVEMGMAHFPILDAEHNPNGFKVNMVNEGNSKRTYLYYNNEAVAPKKDANDPSAWYFTSWGARANDALPMLIADGKNMIGGWDTDTQGGAMTYGEYDAAIEGSVAARDKVYAGLNSGKGESGGDGGYGNYTAIDMWAKYERQTNAKLAIGVKPIVNLKPYVSYVAINGKNDSAEKPFTVSHVGYAGQLLEAYENNRGDATKDTETAQKFGNTISTGFVTRLSSASGFTNGEVAWNITIPVKEDIKSTTTDENGNTTTTVTGEMPTYIKIPETAKLTTQADVDEAEYLAYEMYSGLFEDYAMADDEINIGDEADPDWNSDASFNEDKEPGILDAPDSAEDAETGIIEESYIESMSLLDEAGAEVGDYDNNGNWKTTFNVDSDPTLEDEVNSINRGNIYKVQKIGGSDTSKANIKLRYKLPTQISGPGTVVVGLVIDNLYAPGSVATATFGSSGLDEYHDITSLLTGNSNAVRATSFADYASNKNNEYYTGNTVSGWEASKINYVMNFAGGDGTTVSAGGTTITATGSNENYSLFNGAIQMNKVGYQDASKTHGVYIYGPTYIKVPGPVEITLGNCQFSYSNTITLADAAGNVIGTNSIVKETGSCYNSNTGDNVIKFSYTGEATTLVLTPDTSCFWLPYLSVVSK